MFYYFYFKKRFSNVTCKIMPNMHRSLLSETKKNSLFISPIFEITQTNIKYTQILTDY